MKKRRLNGSAWSTELTVEEKRAILGRLMSMWVPNDDYDLIMSAVEKLQLDVGETTQEETDA